MTTKIVPYKAGSKSAKTLAEALNVKRIKLEGSRWRPRAQDLVINWGSSNTDLAAFNGPARVLNKPDKVRAAANKLTAFSVLSEADISIPEFTTSHLDASGWIEEEKVVVCRTVLNGHSGQGIVLAKTHEELVDAPLYTVYKKKINEFRVHVVQGEVIQMQRKARNRDVPDDQVNWQIRNHSNGFIFAMEGVELSTKTKNLAIFAVAALGLDFGAVDLITNADGESFVLEVNTACGLEGTTVERYVNAFRSVL